MADQEYCLRWNNHQSTLTAIFDKLLKASRYTDCTISAGGQNVAAHKVLLTACSPYFDSVFSGIKDDRHAVIVLSDVTYAELRALMDYMYRGEVNISQDRLAGLLKVAEALQIRGLYEPGESKTRAPPPPAPAPPPVAPSNRPSGLTIERSRRSVPNVAVDFPQEVSRDNAVRSPVPKRRKRATDFPMPTGDPLTASDPAPLPSIDNILQVNVPVLPDPPKQEKEPAFEAFRPKQEFLDTDSIILDDDDDDDNDNNDDGIDDIDQSQQPGTSQAGEGSSQGYPPSWNEHEQSNDEVFMAAQQAVGDGTQGEDKERSEMPPSLDASGGMFAEGAKTPPGVARNKSDRERKIGHRRVLVGGEITYKKIVTTQIMGSIQLGIQHAVGGLASKPERDLLMQDFMTVETTNFPSEGSNHTPAHHYSEFRFRTYAPIAFRYFRDLFGIQPDDFLMSMCSSPLRELSNPGASGSIFYLTEDDEFIIKTVQHKEGEFLQKLLPGYYMNLNQNPRTLLPKFFGLYCYQCNSKNVRLIAMNNLLPSTVRLHQKYDLKGSTYKRKASKGERVKKSPTYKDLDFMEHHPEGIGLEADTYAALVKTIQRDCTVLESFKIMDYSLLVGVHNLDQAARDKAENAGARRSDSVSEDEEGGGGAGAVALNRSKSINRQRLVAHSTAMESIQAESEPIDEEDDVPPGGIPARNSRGERLLLFVGVIDILQSYRLKKKLEHTWKAMIHDGDTVSVHRPGFYAQRFQEFMAKTVFKKIPSLDLPEIKGNHRKFRTLVTSYIALKHSPSKRKSLSARPARPSEQDENAASPAPSGAVSVPSGKGDHPPPYRKEAGPAKDAGPAAPKEGGGFPAVLNAGRGRVPPPVPPRGSNARRRDKGVPCSSTPPPAFEDALRGDLLESSARQPHRPLRAAFDTASVSEVRLECGKSSLSVESGGSRSLAWTPPASVEGSTPTWTEGTPSFTESSSSGEPADRSNGFATPARRARRASDGPKEIDAEHESLFYSICGPY